MIYVTHDQAEAMTMGDQIVVMRDGRVQQIGSPHEVYTAPANSFVGGFLGSPPMNFLKCRVAERDGVAALTYGDGAIVDATIDGALATRLEGRLGAGRDVLVGVRPEDVRATPPENGPSAAVDATVELVEFLGDEQFLALRAGDVPLVARVEPDLEVRADDRRTFYLHLGKARYFDPETEEAIT